MNKFTKLIIASLLIAVGSTGLQAQKTPVLGVVDFQRVLNDYNAFQTADEKVRGSVAPVEEEMQKMQANIQEIVTEGRELETRVNNPAASEEARSEAQARLGELQAQLQRAQVEIQQFRQQAEQLVQQGKQEELAPLYAKAVEAVQTVAEDKGIDIVLPKNAVIYAADTLEISDAVIALLNAGE
jgi:outer membrane protein